MCTVSWVRSHANYQLFFNRDERRTRGPEIPPAEAVSGGVRFLAPRDTDGGGTWLAANELGTTVCILNGYRRQDAEDRAYLSRGLLVAALADAPSAAAVAERLGRTDLGDYRSCVIAAVDPTGAVVVEWDGRERHDDRLGDERVPVISSAFRQTDVRARRVAAYRALPERTPAAVEAYHRGHAGGRGAYSPCMHRPDAATRSLIHVGVEPDAVHLRYTPGPPCRTSSEPALRLPRRAAQSARR